MTQRYTDQEMADILKRAAELQASGDEPTHSLESIQQLGEQVGIGSSLIARAAASLPAHGAPASRIWGEPSAVRVSRRIPGTLNLNDHAALAAVIRDHMPAAGELREVGDGFEFHSGPADNKTVIAVAPAGDETLVRIDVRQSGVKIGLFLAAGAVTGIATLAGTIASPILGAGLLVGVGAGTYAGARLAWHRIAERTRARIADVADALASRKSLS